MLSSLGVLPQDRLCAAWESAICSCQCGQHGGPYKRQARVVLDIGQALYCLARLAVFD